MAQPGNTQTVAGDYEEWAGEKKRVDLQSLANLRATMVLEIGTIIKNFVTDGVAIGISPNDDVLHRFNKGEISHNLYKIFKNGKARGSNGALVPEAPVWVCLVGEYSPSFRWHYHGILRVANVDVLERFKKRIQRLIGRCVCEQIRNYNEYVKYLFKQYLEDQQNFYPWNKDICYVEFKR